MTLIGHSPGGILGRLYLSSEPFLGTSFSGCDYVDHLIMLGGPHLNQGGIQRGGHMARWVQKRVPTTSALLPGSEQIILDNVSHYAIVGQPWYGSEEVIQNWWR